MNKATVILLLMLTLILSACSGKTSNTAAPAANLPGGGAAGELSAPLQVALGTIKLDGTENAVTADQAKELLPLWETLQQLEGSDTAAAQEKAALVSQIQETMSQGQMQAITALGLSRQDLFSVIQSQGENLGRTRNSGSSQNGNTQSGGTSTRRNGGFGGGDFAGGPPPDGGFGGGNPNFQGQRSQSQSGSSTSSTSNSQSAAVDTNRIPTPLIQAVVAYLKTKAGA